MRPYFSRRAFSLMEMAIVLAVSGLMFSFVLSTVQGSEKLTVNCVQGTKQKLQDIRGAVERFARKNDRLPLPAARNIGSDHAQFGRESSGANIDAAGGVSFGALPWQALGLTSDYAGDCWGQKYTYAVTTALTTDASSGGFKDSTVEGNITLKKNATNDVNTEMAYAIISHGEDGLGAVKLNWAADNPDHGWCSGATDIGYTNCLATSATLVDAIYNNGKDAGTNYFDDLIVAAGKPQTVYSSLTYAWGTNILLPTHVATPKMVKTNQQFTIVGIGSHYACGLTTAGAAYCWGENTYGKLGDGTLTQRTTPTAVSGGLTFSTISAGTSHTCGITTAGAAYCWGWNSQGQLGDGTGTQRTIPTAVGGGLTFSSISAGDFHTCGITTAGAAYCWGWNNSYRLGDGTTTTRTSPRAVSGGLTFSTISAGSSHTCGITTAGAAYCWGANSVYQIGDGTTTTRSTPTPVSGGLTFSTLSAVAASNYNCGLTTAGAAYCWGANSTGQLGDGTTTTRTTPTAVSGGLTFSSLSGSCALTATGVAYCWGDNGYGQLGEGTTTTRTTPTAVSGGLTFSSISAANGLLHTCGITTAGVTYCWGFNDRGQLGDEPILWRSAPSVIMGNYSFTDVSAGGNYFCGLNTFGAAYCWGVNTYGQLGDGTNTDRITPTAVSGGISFSAITAGLNHTCGLTTAGAAYCWGGNAGRLGDGTPTNRSTPTPVSGGLTFSTISAGGYHTCGLTTAGAAYCWGGNTYGKLGDGTPTDRNTPTPVSGGLTFTAITAGLNHTCGLTTAGAAYCWGYNTMFGQLGDGTATDRSTPTPVSGGLTFTAITLGYHHTCGLATTGATYCWGYNSDGQVGDGTTSFSRSTPTTPVSGGLAFNTILASYSTTCGLTTAGAAYCWGNNGAGQLGDGTTTTRTTPTAVSGGLTFSKLISANSYSSFGLVGGSSSPFSCQIPSNPGAVGWSGESSYFYQSATPVGACVPEYRACTAGAWTGSYTQQSCTPGCNSRAISWTVGATTCTATMPAQAGGGSIAVPATAGGTGSVTASCSSTGIVTLSGGSCV